MAELSMARMFNRTASRFGRLFVRLKVNKDQITTEPPPSATTPPSRWW